MKKMIIGSVAAAATFLTPIAAYAQTEIEFWHAFTGRLGELVAAQVEQFNASQSDYVVVQSHKGNYSETLNAGIAAFRAGEQPHILMVFEVGTATMMAAEGAIRPVYEVMTQLALSSIRMPILARWRAITRRQMATCFRCLSTPQRRYCG
jgi:sn-glycerol 3-phosphate transport system substrate-binding protein